MLALRVGLRSIRFAPAARVASAMFGDYAHDTWALRDQIQKILLEAQQEDPEWFEEFCRVARRLNPKLFRDLLS